MRVRVRGSLLVALGAWTGLLLFLGCGTGSSGGGGSGGPGGFVLVSPSNATVGLSPALVWTSAAGATSYRVDVATNASFSPAATVYSVTAAGSATFAQMPAGLLATGAFYRWRVTAMNAAGQTGAANAPLPFQTVPAGTLAWVNLTPMGFGYPRALAIESTSLYIVGASSLGTANQPAWR